MIQVGYWRDHAEEDSDLPWPIHSDTAFDGKDYFLKKLSEVEDLSNKIGYRGMSMCRCCNKINGSVTHVYGGYAWPSGYAHYVEQHNIRPPQDFYTYIVTLMTPQTSHEISNIMIKMLDTGKLKNFYKA